MDGIGRVMWSGSIGIVAVVGLAYVLMARQTVVAAEPVRLTVDGRAKRDPVWLNPQGTGLLYVVLDKPNRLQLMKLLVADGSTTPLHPDETRAEFEPAVSVDGRYLAFVQNRGNLSLALVVQDRVENKNFEVPPGGGFSGMHSPAFAPDNSRVLFSYPEQGRQSIFSVDLECKNRRTIIDSDGVNNWPSLSPDGKMMVFASTRDDDYEIYLADPDGTNVRRLTNSPRQDIRPRFSPDGRWIAFTSNRDGNYEIYLIGVDGMGLVRVTDHPEQDDYPLWGLDGKSLVVVSEREGHSDLWRISVP